MTAIGDVALLKDGRYAVAHGGDPERVSVFSADGKKVDFVGRKGSGPGEFRAIVSVRAAATGLAVVDAQLRRTSILDATWKHLRSSPIAGEMLDRPIVLPNGRLLMNSLVRSSSNFGFVLHTINDSGAVVQSFDEPPGGIRFDMPGELYFRSLSLSPEGQVVSAHRTTYRVDVWSVGGQRAGSIVREASWFTPHLGGDGRLNPAIPKKPRLLSAHIDGQGRLWTISRVPAQDWANALKPTQSSSAHEQSYAYESVNRAFDSIVEVIDMTSGRVISSQRFDIAFGGFLSSGDLIAYFSDSDGLQQVRIVRPLLVDGSRR